MHLTNFRNLSHFLFFKNSISFDYFYLIIKLENERVMRIIYKRLEKGKRLGGVTLPWCQINLVDDNSCVHMMIPVSHSRMILGKLRVVWVLAH